MLAGPDHLIVLYVLCDGTQDDLQDTVENDRSLLVFVITLNTFSLLFLLLQGLELLFFPVLFSDVEVECISLWHISL